MAASAWGDPGGQAWGAGAGSDHQSPGLLLRAIGEGEGQRTGAGGRQAQMGETAVHQARGQAEFLHHRAAEVREKIGVGQTVGPLELPAALALEGEAAQGAEYEVGRRQPPTHDGDPLAVQGWEGG